MPALHFRLPIAHESFERFVRRPGRARCFHCFHHLLFFGARFSGGGFIFGPLENCGGAAIIILHNVFPSRGLNDSRNAGLHSGLPSALNDNSRSNYTFGWDTPFFQRGVITPIDCAQIASLWPASKRAPRTKMQQPSVGNPRKKQTPSSPVPPTNLNEVSSVSPIVAPLQILRRYVG